MQLKFGLTESESTQRYSRSYDMHSVLITISKGYSISQMLDTIIKTANQEEHKLEQHVLIAIFAIERMPSKKNIHRISCWPGVSVIK